MRTCTCALGEHSRKVVLSNSLDGREDEEICREAADFWQAESMHRLRQEAVHDVREECRQGRLQWTFAHVYRLINPFPRRGKGQDEEPMDLGSDSEPSGPEGGDPTMVTSPRSPSTPTLIRTEPLHPRSRGTTVTHPRWRGHAQLPPSQVPLSP